MDVMFSEKRVGALLEEIYIYICICIKWSFSKIGRDEYIIGFQNLSFRDGTTF